jgi:hypothetical protein
MIDLVGDLFGCVGLKDPAVAFETGRDDRGWHLLGPGSVRRLRQPAAAAKIEGLSTRAVKDGHARG